MARLETSFVVFLCYSQNTRRHNAMCRDKLVAQAVENIGLKTEFSFHLLLDLLYRFYCQINLIYKCVIIESNSCIDLYLIEKVYPVKFFPIHYVNTSGLKLNFEKGISIQCF